MADFCNDEFKRKMTNFRKCQITVRPTLQIFANVKFKCNMADFCKDEFKCNMAEFRKDQIKLQHGRFLQRPILL